MRHSTNRAPATAVVLGVLVYGCARVSTHYSEVTDVPDGSAGEGGSTWGGSATSGGSPSQGGGKTGGSATGGGNLPGSGGRVAIGGTTGSGGLPTGGAPTGGVRTGGVATGGTAPTGGWTSVCANPAAAFCDDFEAYTVGGPATPWTPSAGSWSVINDTTQVAGDQKVYANTLTDDSKSQAGTAQYANASIEAKFKVTKFSVSAGNAVGVYLRGVASGDDYDLSLAGDGKIYLRRTPDSSTQLECTSGGTNSAASGVTVTSGATGWFRLKLAVSGTKATGITIIGYVDRTGSSDYSEVLRCTPNNDTYKFDTGTAGVFAKGNAPAEYDDVIIVNQ